MKKPRKSSPKKSATPKHEPGRAPGAAFHPGQRVTVTRPGSWAKGHGGAVEVIEPGKVFVRLDGKNVSHCFAPADLAAS